MAKKPILAPLLATKVIADISVTLKEAPVRLGPLAEVIVGPQLAMPALTPPAEGAALWHLDSQHAEIFVTVVWNATPDVRVEVFSDDDILPKRVLALLGLLQVKGIKALLVIAGDVDDDGEGGTEDQAKH